MTEKGRFLGVDGYPCPIDDCPRHLNPYKIAKALDTHLINVHGWTQAQIDEHIKRDYAIENRTVEAEGQDTEPGIKSVTPDAPAPKLITEDDLIATLKGFQKLIDDRLKPMEDTLQLLDQALKGSPSEAGSPSPSPLNPQNTRNPQGKADWSGIGTVLRELGISEKPKTGIDQLADLLAAGNRIADVMRPPTFFDKVAPRMMIRMFEKSGALTKGEAKSGLEEYSDI